MATIVAVFGRKPFVDWIVDTSCHRPDAIFQSQNAPNSILAVAPDLERLQRSHNPHTLKLDIRGPTSRGREGKDEGRGGRVKKKGKGGEGKREMEGRKGKEGHSAPC